MDKYRIAICGDDYLQGVLELTEEEIYIFEKIIYALKPSGPYVPEIWIRNMSAINRRVEAEKLRKREIEEARQREFEEECSHLGKYSCKDVFTKAMVLFE